MPWGVDEVEDVFFAIVGYVIHLYGVAFDGDTTFALEIHVVEYLVLHFLASYCFGEFE